MTYDFDSDKKNSYIRIGPDGSSVAHTYPEITQDLSNVIYVYEGKGQDVGICTGNYYDDPDGWSWYEAWLLEKHTSNFLGWFREDGITFPGVSWGSGATDYVPTITQQDAKNIIDSLVLNDIAIYKQLITVGPALDRAKLLGVDTSSQVTVYKSLLANYQKRQAHMSSSTLLKVQGDITKTKDWIDNLPIWDYLQTISFDGSTLSGFWLAFAIGAAVVAGVGYLVYHEFAPDYEQGKADLKISGAFKTWLEKLPADQQKKITADLQKQLDDAYNKGKFGQWWSDYGGIIKKAAFLLGGLWVSNKVIGMIRKPKESK